MLSLQTLIAEHDWYLHVWQVRYGKGMFMMIAPSIYHIKEIQDISTDADIPALELDFYLNDEGSWLPIVKGENLEELLKQLEQKVKIDNDKWKKAVYFAFECIIEESDSSYGLKIAIDNKVSALFKPENL